jgi:CheY-like chemotaxis protein
MKIMLVDDDRTMRTILKTLLEIENYEVVLWNGQPGSDILAQAHDEQPDIILLDVYLREINGIDILRKLRSDSLLAPTRVIMTSGSPVKDDCILAGANAFLMKPYMPDDLIRLLRQAA